MYSLWNPTDNPQAVVVTLHYDNGSGKYKIPVPIGPQSSVMLDLKNIIESNAPDADGNVFPANTSEGGATIESADEAYAASDPIAPTYFYQAACAKF